MYSNNDSNTYALNVHVLKTKEWFYNVVEIIRNLVQTRKYKKGVCHRQEQPPFAVQPLDHLLNDLRNCYRKLPLLSHGHVHLGKGF